MADGGNETKTYTIPNTLFTKVPDFAHSEANSAVHVTVKQLRKELHHGNLTCVVANEVGWDRQSIRVTFVRESFFSIPCFLSQTVCIVSGLNNLLPDPTPFILHYFKFTILGDSFPIDILIMIRTYYTHTVYVAKTWNWWSVREVICRKFEAKFFSLSLYN